MDDEKEYLKLVQQLTAPRLLTPERQKQDAERPANEPPMPSWWDEDDDADDSFAAAKALGSDVTLT